MKKFFRANYFAIIMALIYIPIVVMIVFSFNAGTTVSTWRGWSTRWYRDFFQNSPLIKSIITSLFVALISTTVSLIIGVAAAIGLNRSSRRSRRKWLGIANIPLINADVVTAVSLMMVFLIANLRFGLFTLLMAHISFNVPYVLITVMPRLRKIDQSLLEAGEDLGANKWQLLTRVILPVLRPAIVAAGAIAFSMSFDDFIISYFTGGSLTNVSTYIYTMKKIRPFIFAFGTILVLVIVLGIITWNAIIIARQSKATKLEKLRNQTYKQDEISKLQKKLTRLYAAQQGDYESVTSRNIRLWIPYLWLKLELFFYSTRNYDKKITRLEWKRYKLRSKINREKRYYDRQKLADKRLARLQLSLAKTNDVQKAAKLTLQIDKVQEKLDFLKEEIEDLEDREAASLKRAQKIENEILELQNRIQNYRPKRRELLNINRRIKRLEADKIEVLEGKTNHKLRLVVERLRDLQDKNYDAIFALNDKKNHYEKLIFIREPLNERGRINLQAMIDTEQGHLIKLRSKVAKQTDKYLPNYGEDETKIKVKGWFGRSWKILGVTLIGLAAFSGLTVAYVMTNTYDLVIGNWGEYIDPILISEFERENNVHVNYQEYDSNETLYNKLFTFSYDVMVPSDYMVNRLAQEGQLEKLDYSLLNVEANWAKQNYLNYLQADDTKVTFDKELVDLLENYEVKGGSAEGNLLTYSVPYFWGDLVIVVNPTTNNLQWLGEQITKAGGDAKLAIDTETGQIDQRYLSWDILREAARSGKKVALNNDPKNLFAIPGEVLYQTPNITELDQLEAATAYLKDNFIDRSNVSLNNDELIDKVGRGDFDFAMMYNGDALSANKIYNGEDVDEGDGEEEELAIQALQKTQVDKTTFLFGRPNIQANTSTGSRYQTTNVFSDNMVISSHSNHKELAYKFVNFIFAHSAEISEYVGVASPISSAMEELTKPGAVFGGNYKPLYYPCVDSEAIGGKKYQVNPGEGMAFLYNPTIDDKLVDEYNLLIAGKIS